MTIRSKLTLLIVGLLAFSLGLLGAGVILISNSITRDQERERVTTLENLIHKAAQDALLQKDDLLLVSYVNFIKAQYPSLATVRIVWQAKDRIRNLSVGEAPPGARIMERDLNVSDPSDPSRRVTIQLGIDRDLFDRIINRGGKQLVRVVLGMFLLTVILSMGLSYWFAGSLTGPLNSLVSLASDISAGKLGGRLEWSSQDEIGHLVKVFNKMSQRLEDLEETKRNFVSSVTHELRSPLGAIESFLHLIQAKLKGSGNGATAQTQEYLGRIQVNVQRLGWFINDLLEVAKIEKGKMECVLKPMALHEMSLEVCQFFEAKASSQGVRLLSRLDGLPPILGDHDRLRQVIVNLVSNSLKFTPKGGQVVISGEQFREAGKRWIEVTISDTGRGIEQRDLDRLFKAFSQGRNVSEGVAGTKGTGLGLFITKSIIEQHGGRVELRSAPGKGTQVVFSLMAAA